MGSNNGYVSNGTINLKALLDVSQAKSAINDLSSTINKLDFTKQLKNKFATKFTNMLENLSELEGLQNKEVLSNEDLSRSVELIKSLSKEFNALQAQTKTVFAIPENFTKTLDAVIGKYKQASKLIEEYQGDEQHSKDKNIRELNSQIDSRKKEKSSLEQKKTENEKELDILKQLKEKQEAYNKAVKEFYEIKGEALTDNSKSKVKGNLSDEIGNTQAELDKLTKQRDKVKPATKTNGKFRANANEKKEARFYELDQQVKETETKLDKLKSLLDEIKRLEDEAKQIGSNSSDSKVRNINLATTGRNYDQNIAVKDDSIKNLTDEIDDATEAIKNFQEQIDNYSPDTDKLDELRAKLKEIGLSFTDEDWEKIDLSKLKSELEETAKSKADTTMQNISSDIEERLENLSKPLEEMGEVSRDTLEPTVSLGKELESFKDKAAYFFGLSNAINLFQRGIRQAVSTVTELDKIMTETAVVTNFDVSDMWAQLPEYTAIANKLGTTTKGAYETMTLFYQQGLSTNEVMQVGAETMKMARIANLDYATATNYMTAALRGFNMEINETSAQHVNDVYSQLAAITASDVREISIAMTKTASLANNANMEFESTAAYLSQIIETTRESAETAGTALKTVIARFTELKKDPSLIENVEGESIDANKIETALKSIGVALRDETGQFRDLDDVFLDINSRWDSLSTNQQRYIATMAAGSRQQSRFIAMMSDYARTQELMSAAYNSEGASQRQFAKTEESLESKTNQLNNAWNEFLMGLANSDIIKTGVDALTGLLNIVNKLTSFFGDGVSGILKWYSAIKLISTASRAFKSGGIFEKGTSWYGNTEIGQRWKDTINGTSNARNRVVDNVRNRISRNSSGSNSTISSANDQANNEEWLIASSLDELRNSALASASALEFFKNSISIPSEDKLGRPKQYQPNEWKDLTENFPEAEKYNKSTLDAVLKARELGFGAYAFDRIIGDGNTDPNYILGRSTEKGVVGVSNKAVDPYSVLRHEIAHQIWNNTANESKNFLLDKIAGVTLHKGNYKDVGGKAGEQRREQFATWAQELADAGYKNIYDENGNINTIKVAGEIFARAMSAPQGKGFGSYLSDPKETVKRKGEERILSRSEFSDFIRGNDRDSTQSNNLRELFAEYYFNTGKEKRKSNIHTEKGSKLFDYFRPQEKETTSAAPENINTASLDVDAGTVIINGEVEGQSQEEVNPQIIDNSSDESADTVPPIELDSAEIEPREVQIEISDEAEIHTEADEPPLAPENPTEPNPIEDLDMSERDTSDSEYDDYDSRPRSADLQPDIEEQDTPEPPNIPPNNDDDEIYNNPQQKFNPMSAKIASNITMAASAVSLLTNTLGQADVISQKTASHVSTLSSGVMMGAQSFGVWGAVIGAVVSGIIIAIDEFETAEEKLERVSKTAQVAEKQVQEVSSNEKGFEEDYESYRNVSKAFNALTSDSVEYYNSLKSVNDQALELIDTLGLVYGEGYTFNNKGAIEIDNSEYQKQVKAYQEYQKALTENSSVADFVTSQYSNDVTEDSVYFSGIKKIIFSNWETALKNALKDFYNSNTDLSFEQWLASDNTANGVQNQRYIEQFAKQQNLSIDQLYADYNVKRLKSQNSQKSSLAATLGTIAQNDNNASKDVEQLAIQQLLGNSQFIEEDYYSTELDKLKNITTTQQAQAKYEEVFGFKTSLTDVDEIKAQIAYQNTKLKYTEKLHEVEDDLATKNLTWQKNYKKLSGKQILANYAYEKNSSELQEINNTILEDWIQNSVKSEALFKKVIYQAKTQTSDEEKQAILDAIPQLSLANLENLTSSIGNIENLYGADVGLEALQDILKYEISDLTSQPIELLGSININGNLINDLYNINTVLKETHDLTYYSETLFQNLFKSIVNSVQAPKKALTDLFANASDATDKLISLAKGEKEIDASDVEDVADECDYLAKELDVDIINASALAEIINLIADTDIDFSDLSNDFIKAVNEAEKLRQYLEDSYSFIDKYDEKRSGKDIADFIEKRAKTITDSLSDGRLWDEEALQSFETLFGKEGMANYNKAMAKASAYWDRNPWASGGDIGNKISSALNPYLKVLDSLQKDGDLSALYDYYSGTLGRITKKGGTDNQYIQFENGTVTFGEGVQTFEEATQILSQAFGENSPLIGLMLNDMQLRSPGQILEWNKNYMENAFKNLGGDGYITGGEASAFYKTESDNIQKYFDYMIGSGQQEKLGFTESQQKLYDAGDYENLFESWIQTFAGSNGINYLNSGEQQRTIKSNAYDEYENQLSTSEKDLIRNTKSTGTYGNKLTYDPQELIDKFKELGYTEEDAVQLTQEWQKRTGNLFEATATGINEETGEVEEFTSVSADAQTAIDEANKKAEESYTNYENKDRINAIAEGIKSAFQDVECNIDPSVDQKQIETIFSQIQTYFSQNPIQLTFSGSPNNSGGSNTEPGGNAFGGGAAGGYVPSYAAGKDNKLNPGLALTGEEGPEIIWNKEKGYSYITGQNGPQYQDLEPGDRVFDAKQSKKILNGSFAKGRGNNLNLLLEQLIASLSSNLNLQLPQFAQQNQNNASVNIGNVNGLDTTVRSLDEINDNGLRNVDQTVKEINQDIPILNQEFGEFKNNLLSLDPAIEKLQQLEQLFKRLIPYVTALGGGSATPEETPEDKTPKFKLLDGDKSDKTIKGINNEFQKMVGTSTDWKGIMDEADSDLKGMQSSAEMASSAIQEMSESIQDFGPDQLHDKSVSGILTTISSAATALIKLSTGDVKGAVESMEVLRQGINEFTYGYQNKDTDDLTNTEQELKALQDTLNGSADSIQQFNSGAQTSKQVTEEFNQSLETFDPKNVFLDIAGDIGETVANLILAKDAMEAFSKAVGNGPANALDLISENDTFSGIADLIANSGLDPETAGQLLTSIKEAYEGAGLSGMDTQGMESAYNNALGLIGQLDGQSEITSNNIGSIASNLQLISTINLDEFNNDFAQTASDAQSAADAISKLSQSLGGLAGTNGAGHLFNTQEMTDFVDKVQALYDSIYGKNGQQTDSGSPQTTTPKVTQPSTTPTVTKGTTPKSVDVEANITSLSTDQTLAIKSAEVKSLDIGGASAKGALASVKASSVDVSGATTTGTVSVETEETNPVEGQKTAEQDGDLTVDVQPSEDPGAVEGQFSGLTGELTVGVGPSTTPEAAAAPFQGLPGSLVIYVTYAFGKSRHGKVGSTGISEVPGYAKGKNNTTYKTPGSGKGVSRNYSGISLVGEEGPELMMRDGTPYMLGTNGPDFTYVDKDDTIFTHQQTERILNKDTKEKIPGFAKGYGISVGLNSGRKVQGDSNDDEWDNPYDWLYNLMEDIAELERKQTELAEKREDLLKNQATSYKELVSISRQQLENLQQTRNMRENELSKRLIEMQKFLADNEEYADYGTYNYDDKTIEIDWDKIQELDDSNNKEQGEKVQDYIDQLEEIQDYIEDAEDAIIDLNNQIDELLEQQKETYDDLEARIYEALVNQRQEQIDTLDETYESISSSNSDILESLQKVISDTRQIRENTKTEEDLADKEARLAFLRRDTSGANLSEIKSLEEDLRDARESYSDSLVDQKLSDLQDIEDKASDQRDKQIEILQSQLDWQQQSGYFWEEAFMLLTSSFTESGQFVMSSQLADLLRSQEEYFGKSEIGQQTYDQELGQSALDAMSYLEMAYTFGAEDYVQGKQITLDIVDELGNTIKTVIGEIGQEQIGTNEDGTAIFSYFLRAVDEAGKIVDYTLDKDKMLYDIANDRWKYSGEENFDYSGLDEIYKEAESEAEKKIKKDADEWQGKYKTKYEETSEYKTYLEEYQKLLNEQEKQEQLDQFISDLESKLKLINETMNVLGSIGKDDTDEYKQLSKDKDSIKEILESAYKTRDEYAISIEELTVSTENLAKLFKEWVDKKVEEMKKPVSTWYWNPYVYWHGWDTSAAGSKVLSYASGSRKVHPGLALTGEEGPELLWNKEKGYAYMLGANGPQYAQLNPGDQIFTAEETKAILNRPFMTLDQGAKQFESYASGLGNRQFGSTNNTFTFNIDAEIGSDYDVDRMAERIKQDIYNSSTYRNVNALNFMR